MQRGAEAVVEPPPPIADRERFLAFALTAAEMLLEATPEGVIGFAAGTFRARFGRPAEGWVGRPVQELLAAADRPGFDTAFALLQARDRLPPTAFRLADAGGTPMALAGLRLPRPDGARLCLTLSALPPAASGAPRLAAGKELQAAVEAGLRAGQPGTTLGLLELAGPDGALEPQPDLGRRIRQALSASISPDGLAGELAGGRYGLLGTSAADLAGVAAQIEVVMREAGLEAAVSTRCLALQQGSLSPMQAARALRYALSTFAQGGAAALEREGFGGGLAGFVAAACDRAAALRRTIADQRLGLAFQPIVSLRDRTPHHYEALLRPQPTIGCPIEGAADFVTFAETVGLSEELDWVVVEMVCRAARRGEGTRIACNLSGLSLQSPAFRARLLELLRAEPSLVRRLLIEVTETAEIEDEAAAVETVEALRGLGLPLCIDDFGAGAAAFRYLRSFRCDFVKIDGLYVANALRSEQDRGFVAAMVDLARNVGAEVVAERIETEAEAQAMHELGVGLGQGWLFGRPGPLPRGPARAPAG